MVVARDADEDDPFSKFEDEDDDEDDYDSTLLIRGRSLVKTGVLWFCRLNVAKRKAKLHRLGGKMTRFCWEIRGFC